MKVDLLWDDEVPIRILVLALVLFALALQPATASSAWQTPWKGVNTNLFFGHEDTLDALTKAIIAKIQWLRDDGFSWVNVETVQGTWTWDHTDMFTSLTPTFDILASLVTAPSWANGRTDSDWKCGDPKAWWWMPSDAAPYGQYAYQTAKRYPQVKAWEIWNEPNLYAFDPPVPDAVKYVNLLKAAYTNIKSANPSALVVGGAFGQMPTNYFRVDAWCGSYVEADISPPDFLRWMYAAGAKGYFDVLSVHLYGADSNQLQQLQTLRDIMLANGDDKPIWVTEIGYSTSPGQLTQEQQAQSVSTDIPLLRSLGHVQKIFYNRLVDTDGNSSADADMGLLQGKLENQVYKLAYYVYGSY